jgi:tRNA-specific 2-thiouridylase
MATYHLLQAKDKTKDQSYFLYRLGQNDLRQVLFPVGDFTKDQVRKMARDWGLPVAESRESQDICFLSQIGKNEFLGQRIPEKIIPGEVVNVRREVIGRHRGLPLYTIGQRKGFEISSSYQKRLEGKMPSLFVVKKILSKNQLMVGTRKEAMRKEFLVKDLSMVGNQRPLISDQTLNGKKLFTKIRSTGKLLAVSQLTTDNLQLPTNNSEEDTSKVSTDSTLEVKKEMELKVVLNKPVLGVAPGQSAVFYRPWEKEEGSFEVLGGGVIGEIKDTAFS